MPPPQTNGFRDSSKLLNEFQFEGEMGPVMDMSTFPPLMAPHPTDDPNEHGTSGLAMDSILSSNFWDSVLVPGAHLSLFTPSVLIVPSNRVQYNGRADGRLCVWRQRERVDHASDGFVAIPLGGKHAFAWAWNA